MHMKFALSLAAAALCATGATAMAQQRIDSVGRQQVPAAMQQSLSVETDLAGAARIIVPSGWKALVRQGINAGKPSSVSTKMREPWTDALDRWLTAEHLVARIDWDHQTVYLDAAPVVGTPAAKAAVPSNIPKPEIANAGTAQPSPVVAQVAPPQQARGTQSEQARTGQQWQVRVSDIRLDATLERWAKQAGYTLVWDADRHVLITAEDTFFGSFEAALNRILNSPAVRGSDYPLEAVIYQNTPPVLRITGLGEQQTNKE